MRQQANWNKILPGDIISFRYKSRGQVTLHSILVLGIDVPYKTKDGKTNRHLVGMKLESRNIPITDSRKLLTEFKKVGDIKVLQKTKNNEAIIRLGVKGKRDEKIDGDFDKLKSLLKSTATYRTYDYQKARTYTVYYEPININPQELKELMGEN